MKKVKSTLINLILPMNHKKKQFITNFSIIFSILSVDLSFEFFNWVLNPELIINVSNICFSDDFNNLVIYFTSVIDKFLLKLLTLICLPPISFLNCFLYFFIIDTDPCIENAS